MTHDPAEKSKPTAPHRASPLPRPTRLPGITPRPGPSNVENPDTIKTNHHRTDTVNDRQILCPNCRTEIKLTESLAAPLLAETRKQSKQAGPLVLVDELEKAGTRTDHGRLWDCLLGFLEPGTASRYPDPALQTNLDLSQVSYVATANSLDALPSPLRDRFRIITFPKPTANDLDALLPAVTADLATERGLDHRWIEPLTGFERDADAAL
jgi:ATPase family associated with various cellular activities (AAA)